MSDPAKLLETATRLLNEACRDFGITPSNDGYDEAYKDALTRQAQVDMAKSLYEIATMMKAGK